VFAAPMGGPLLSSWHRLVGGAAGGAPHHSVGASAGVEASVPPRRRCAPRLSGPSIRRFLLFSLGLDDDAFQPESYGSDRTRNTVPGVPIAWPWLPNCVSDYRTVSKGWSGVRT